MGPIYSGYWGMFLFGAGCLAVGIFSSSLTDNQMVAGVIGFGLLLLFWILDGQALSSEDLWERH